MFKTLLTIASGALFFSACYEDKGNYDYRFDQLNELGEFRFTPAAFKDVDGTTIELQQPIAIAKTERISVSVPQSLAQNTDQLDFLWRISYERQGKTFIDTIRSASHLDLQLEADQASRYKVLLSVTDRSTGLSRYQQFSVKTRPIFKNSLFVLHGNSASAMQLGNIEEQGSDTIIRTNAYGAAYPNSTEQPFARAIGLCYSSVFDVATRSESNTLGVFNQDGSCLGYQPFGLGVKFRNGYLLPADETDFLYDRNISVGASENGNDHRLLIGRDGRLFTAGSFLCFHRPGEVQTGESDYEIQTATITAAHFIGWDKLHDRFLYLSAQQHYGWSESEARKEKVETPIYEANIDLSALSEILSPVGKDAIYAYTPYKDDFDNAHAFFLFRDRKDGKAYLYELTRIPVSGDGKKIKAQSTPHPQGKDKDEADPNFDNSAPAYTLTAKALPNFPTQILKSGQVLYNAWFTSNHLFFAEGDKVYRYNTADGTRHLLYTAPEGYHISMMKWRTTDTGLFKGDLGRYLSIGLNKADEGAVAEIKLTTAADLDESFTPRFYDRDAEGRKFNNIVDLQFAHIYSYQLPQ